MSRSTWLEKLKGFGVAALALVVVVAFAVLFLMLPRAGAWMARHLLPFLFPIGAFVFAVDVLILLPLSIPRRFRPLTSVAIYVSSFIFGFTVWLYGLFYTFTLWGPFAVLIGIFLLGIGVVPFAIIATALKGMWAEVGTLILLVVLTFGCRVISVVLSEPQGPRSPSLDE
jgi:hypothetical protein